MFKSARIKLTLAYVLIVATITFSFSVVVYINVSTFTERAIQMHERRVVTRLQEFRGAELLDITQGPFTKEAVDQVRENTISLLTIVNIIILFLSGAFAYWFAGKTLNPIEQMTKKQKKFIADASHELKTPLTAIKTNLEVNIRDKNLTLKTAKNLLKSTIDDVDSLTLLTNNLIKQSRIQEVQTQSLEVIDLENLLENVVLKFQDKLKSKNININLETTKVNVKADKHNIIELITILIDNAVKFSNTNSEIKIVLDSFKNSAILKIMDSGIGINEKDLPFIFDRFYKGDYSRSKIQSDGFGLGLSIAKEIVNTYKGTITANNNPNSEGATFNVKLPIHH